MEKKTEEQKKNEQEEKNDEPGQERKDNEKVKTSEESQPKEGLDKKEDDQDKEKAEEIEKSKPKEGEESSDKGLSDTNTVYHIMRSKDECSHCVRKISEREVSILSRSARDERKAIISDSICKTPINPGPVKSAKEMKEWVNWATNVVDLAEKWSSWIEEAEIKAKSGKEDDPDWGKFKRDTESQGNEFRRNKKNVEKLAQQWKDKCEGQFK